VPRPELVLSCEHAGHGVPPTHRALFAGHGRLLASHRGWDPGALDVARRLARAFGAPLVATTTTRLLVDANRSPHNPAVFSAITRPLPRETRAALLERHHRPHWERVRRALSRAGAPALHVAVHSFVPALHGRRRDFDVGLLYDPKRVAERRLAATWQALLRREGLRVRRNAPYRGDSDGLTTALRRERPARAYLGIELELNQARLGDAARQRALGAAVASTLHEALAAIPR